MPSAAADPLNNPPTTPPAIGHDVPPELLAAIERSADVKLSDVPAEEIANLVAISKKLGNDAFARGRFREAATAYTRAIAGDAKDKALFGNRSAALLEMGEREDALGDALRCVALDATWPKAFYRVGRACASLGDWVAARDAYAKCASLARDRGDPPDAGVEHRLAHASHRACALLDRMASSVASNDATSPFASEPRGETTRGTRSRRSGGRRCRAPRTTTRPRTSGARRSYR